VRQGQQRRAEQEQAKDDFARQLERAEPEERSPVHIAAGLHGESPTCLGWLRLDPSGSSAGPVVPSPVAGALHGAAVPRSPERGVDGLSLVSERPLSAQLTILGERRRGRRRNRPPAAGLRRTGRGDIVLWQEWGGGALALDGKIRDNPLMVA
jgi:hypothetical protein